MSKITSLKKYITIIQKLKIRPHTYQELCNFLQRKFDFEDLDLKFDKRTFQRDINDIMTLFGINIFYDKKIKKYRIEEEETILNYQFLDAFEWINLINVMDQVKPFIAFDTRNTSGVEFIGSILNAIQNQQLVKVGYKKFGYEHEISRIIMPLAVKQSQYRWYLVAKSKDDNEIKTFALDRMQSVEKINEKFTYPIQFNVNDYFKDCFGVITAEPEEQPENILLSFDPIQAMYIKTLPLHSSQVIVSDTKEECIIKLKLFITFDFVRELLSYGKLVKILQPGSLKRTIESFK